MTIKKTAQAVKTTPKKKKIVVKASRPAAKQITKKDSLSGEPTKKPHKEWKKVQTAEGWKRNFVREKNAEKSKR